MKPWGKYNSYNSEVMVLHIWDNGIDFMTGCLVFPLSYEDFPCFKGVPEEKVKYVIEPETDVYYWPDLDVQLTMEMLHNPKLSPYKPK